MKKNVPLTLIFALLAIFSSCKKEDSVPTGGIEEKNTVSNREKNDLIMRGTEPVGGAPVDLQLQSDGSYLAYYAGVTLTFTDVSRRTPPYQSGEPVGSISIYANASSGVTVSSDGGPYFSGYQLVYGMPPGYLSGLSNYRTAYSDYIFDKKNSSGELLQPNIPIINDYLPSISGQTKIITGKVVMWKSSESGLAVVPYDYVGPKAGEPIE
ncbi:hypothetical protein ACTJKC_10230 [Pedobacter sp. 22226]|uniref:hypothetical protein n=1 Tax=Pedobacter sp. 22226 TaxID=3453894 RepID=UPI003F87FAE6